LSPSFSLFSLSPESAQKLAFVVSGFSLSVSAQCTHGIHVECPT
jgi:hypothetical protein